MYDVRTRYLADAVATAGPAKLLTMLYDRLFGTYEAPVRRATP